MGRSAALLSLLLLRCATVAPVTAPPAAAPAVKAEAPPRLEAPALTVPTLRLPAGAHPTRYTAELEVVPGEETFHGKMVIELTAEAELPVLWLNAVGLDVSSAHFVTDGQAIGARTSAHDPFLAVVPARPLSKGGWQLTLEYRGPLSRKEESGLFQIETGGADYAMTQFESVGARRAFPCFDEPSFKVPLQLTVRLKADQLAVANAPVMSQAAHGEFKTVVFAPTKPLPTYLWALAVGPWDVLDAGTAGHNHTPLRIITPRGRTDEAKYAAGQLKDIVEALEAYFGSPYPYEKLDQLAMPFSYGAMENPGLVTWGEQMLLARPAEDTAQRRKYFHITASHELAHMWFGDLVTLEWWDDVWLNESFAEWLMWKVSNALHPEWHLESDRVAELAQALAADSLATARQIRQPIVSYDDIETAFDSITYAKGASVLAQFEAWLSPPVFQRGVRQYLAAHAYGNARADDFFAALTAAAGRDVTDALKTFTDQPGAPLLSVSVQCPATGAPTATVKQSRALPIGTRGDRTLRWQVPFCLKSPAGRQCEVLTDESKVFPLDGAKRCPTWLMPNEGFGGYFRSVVTLPHQSVGATLRGLVTNPALSSNERMGLFESLTALVDSGELDAGEALEALPLALQSPEPRLWQQAAEVASSLSALVAQTDRPRFEKWLRTVFLSRARQLGFNPGPSEDADVQVARRALLSVAGLLGRDLGLRTEAQGVALKWLARRASVPAEVATVALTLAANGPDVTVKDRMLAAALAEKESAPRGKLLGALGRINDPARLQPNFELVMSPALPARETFTLLVSAANSPYTREAAWAFAQQNFDQLAARLPSTDTFGGSGPISLAAVAGSFCDQAHLTQAKAFFEPRAASYVGMRRVLDQTYEGIELCIAVEARQRASLAAFLARQR